jgi:hypothetical protein
MTKLVTVVGHGVELLPHFIEHYSKHVQVIYIVVYVTDKNPNIEDEIKNIICQYSDVKIVLYDTIRERIFDWEKVTSLYNEVKTLYPNDWWVVADIDEFHLYPKDDLDYVINNCNRNGWDIVRGGFIDRIGKDGEFSELKKGFSLWEQFPNAGFFRYPMSKACPNKICVMKGYVELTPGQHYAKIDGHTTWTWQGWNHPLINPNDTVQVHHFKWDSTSIERVKAVADVKQEYSFSDEYKLMYWALRKSNFTIDLNNNEYMFELGLKQPEFSRYPKWNNLINKIKSI